MPVEVYGTETWHGSVFPEGPLPLPRTWGRQLQRKRRGAEIQPLPTKRRRQTFPEERELLQEVWTIDFCTHKRVYVYPFASCTARDADVLSVYHCVPIKMHGNTCNSYRASKTKPPASGKSALFLTQLGTDNPESMGTGSRARLQSVFQTATLPGYPTGSVNPLSKRGTSHAGGDSEHVRETCHRGNHTQRAGFSVNHLPCAKERPVINLKNINKFVCTEHFKMEGIHILRDLLKAGDWMTKVDLKDAYFMIPIHEEDRAFLKFSFKQNTYQFRCLPFGLACVPWIFTKILKPLTAQLPQLGMRMIVYIDDILRVHGDGTGPCYGPNVPVREPGLCGKQAKVCSGPCTSHRLSGFPGRFGSTGAEPPSRKGEEDQGRDSAHIGGQSSYSQEAVPAPGPTAGSNQGNSPGSAVLPPAAAGTSKSTGAISGGWTICQPGMARNLCQRNPL